MTYFGEADTESLQCDDRKDLDGPSGGVFHGQSFYEAQPSSYIPTWAPGTSDVAMEWVFRTRTVQSMRQDGVPQSGLLTDPASSLARIGLNPDDDLSATSVFFRYNGTLSQKILTASSITTNDWAHYALNCDRDGNVELFVDGTSVLTADISADAATSYTALPLVPTYTNFGAHQGGFDEVDAFQNIDNFWFVPLSAMAVHSSLLAAADITSNAQGLSVNNDANTIAMWDFMNFVDASGNDVTVDRSEKEFDKRLIEQGIRGMLNPEQIPDFVPGATQDCPSPQFEEMWAPKVQDGTLFVKDMSGNGRHYGLKTELNYTTASPAKCAFSDTGA